MACIDARRGEVFCAGAGLEPQALTPEALAAALPAGAVVAGDGAVRYRDLLAGAEIPPDDSPLHVPHARHHAALHDVAGPARSVLPARPGRRSRARREGGPMIAAVELRPLKTSDLDAIETVERASYPTPWSRSMFAGELAKPSGICLGAFQGEDMLGYLIVARYVDAWHVMNVAIDPEWRGRGVARRDARAPVRPHRGRQRARVHARGAGLKRTSPSICTSRSGSSPRASAAGTTPTTARTR